MKHAAVPKSIWHSFQIGSESASTQISVRVLKPFENHLASFDGCPHGG